MSQRPTPDAYWHEWSARFRASQQFASAEIPVQAEPPAWRVPIPMSPDELL